MMERYFVSIEVPEPVARPLSWVVEFEGDDRVPAVVIRRDRTPGAVSWSFTTMDGSRVNGCSFDEAVEKAKTFMKRSFRARAMLSSIDRGETDVPLIDGGSIEISSEVASIDYEGEIPADVAEAESDG